jgi:hypothetical protein
MWQVLAWASWGVTAVIFIWLVWDFFRVNMNYSESSLLSSREGVDELFAAEPEK